jgi:formiminoglutamase
VRKPVAVSIPHGGWRVAEEIRDIWALSPKDAFHDGDPYTNHIYDFSDRVRDQMVMEYYRAVVDLNRAPDDIAPENPDGVIKSHTCWNVPVYKADCLPDEDLKETLLEKYYFPYHRWLAEAVADRDVRLLVDCHSMAAYSPPIEEDEGTVRPLICLGNLGDEHGEIESVFNRVTCEPDLIRFMADEFMVVLQHEEVEVSPPAVVAMNVPFNGGYITRNYGGRGVPVVQIEMSRALYLNARDFDEGRLTVQEGRIKDLNEKVWKVISRTADYL